jgi:uncharacterized protein YndB with AHSA1/START domain
MATNTARFDVEPVQVWTVLADPSSYGHWVVGSKDVRAVEGDWPEPGSRFHHTVGYGPVEVNDDTLVLEAHEPERLVLEAHARPSGTARVTLELHARDDGRTDVSMEEHPVEGLAKLIHNPLQDKLIHRRNDESLRRLKYLAETRAGVTAG